MQRRKTKILQVGDVKIGGNHPIVVQSMCNTKTADVHKTAAQIDALAAAGCEIARLAVLDEDDAAAIKALRKGSKIPLVADIHFDYRLALTAIESGVDKVRINPGNIGSCERVSAVAAAAKAAGVPIRIGINTGSLDAESLAQFGSATPEALVHSALTNVALLEDCGFSDIAVSIKASSVVKTIEANCLFASQTDYPLHLGVTEAGLPEMGSIKSAIGIGSLLAQGIGDTIRVSLTDDPVAEIPAAINILRALSLREYVEVISCPSCGRCRVDLIAVANKVNKSVAAIQKNCKVAVMGCAVNGPGEARDADVGIAGGVGEFLLFKKGEIIGKYPEDKAVELLLSEIIAL